MDNELQAPFPYFGGKGAVADKVWAALGQPNHYIEPFFGSGAASCWIGAGLTCPTQRPHLSDAGMGVQEPYNINIYQWFRKLSERLRDVRVVCGDWSRVCGGNWQNNIGICGVFFDPPYGVEDRITGLYGGHDSTTVANDVNKWCIDRGQLRDYRIVLTGYEEHMNLVSDYGWRYEQWKTSGGYANLAKNESRGKNNRKREVIYYSPYCINDNQEELFK